ncbi:MAG: hypothetical protein F2840_11025 [Actinobacteria bacterium]|jgi:phosphotriesterase-related protein|uniref:Unannotated protein n=1 Tax=freshwater metagenome TaxID=449393 RepID=A0A6J7L692_9ZZZZ|nr:hypothetical protein [Actinomycetota bacterium]
MTPRQAVAVLGSVPKEDLGLTLPHEHLILDFGVRYTPAEDESSLGPQPLLADRWRLLARPAGYRVNLEGTDLESATYEATLFQQAGGHTIVDLTGLGLAPDVSKLKIISQSTGLNVIAGTGFYIAGSLPNWIYEADTSALARHLVDDLTFGGTEGIRRGAIGEVAIETGEEVEFRCLRAAARAQAETGAPVFLHVMSGLLPQFRPLTERIITVYKQEGGNLDKLVLCHQDGSGDDIAYQIGLLERGIRLMYDTFGSEGVFGFGTTYVQLPTDTQRIVEVSRLVDCGFADMILVSQDLCYQSAKRSWGGWGFTHLIESLRPRFYAAGIEEVMLNRLMTQNPADVLAFE